MNSKKTETEKKSFLSILKLIPALKGKYTDKPLFKDKADKANYILKTVGIPNLDAADKKVVTHKKRTPATAN